MHWIRAYSFHCHDLLLCVNVIPLSFQKAEEDWLSVRGQLLRSSGKWHIPKPRQKQKVWLSNGSDKKCVYRSGKLHVINYYYF